MLKKTLLIIVIVLLIIFFYYLIIFFTQVWNILYSSDVNTQSLLIGIIFTAIISLISLFISKKLDRKNQEQGELRKLRTLIYKDFISFSFKLLYSVKENNDSIDSKKIDKKIEELTPSIILQASEETILSYQKFRGSDKETSLDNLLNLSLKMRQDLGYSNKDINKETLKSLFIQENNTK